MSSPTPQTPQELLALEVSELSASGDKPINASTAFAAFPDVTAREAWTNTYWKETALLNLLHRPRLAGEADDQYGHVLSTRAEVLQILALVTALCEAAGISVNKILGAVQYSTQVQPPATPPQAS